MCESKGPPATSCCLCKDTEPSQCAAALRAEFLGAGLVNFFLLSAAGACAEVSRVVTARTRQAGGFGLSRKRHQDGRQVRPGRRLERVAENQPQQHGQAVGLDEEGMTGVTLASHAAINGVYGAIYRPAEAARAPRRLRVRFWKESSGSGRLLPRIRGRELGRGGIGRMR